MPLGNAIQPTSVDSLPEDWLEDRALLSRRPPSRPTPSSCANTEATPWAWW